MSFYVPCPRCGAPDPERVKFTWWGGLLGPKMLSHVKCKGCGNAYNGETGQDNTQKIVLYLVVSGAVAFVVFFVISFMVAVLR